MAALAEAWAPHGALGRHVSCNDSLGGAGGGWQPALPDMLPIHDREVSSEREIWAIEQLQQEVGRLGRRRRHKPQKDHARPAGTRRARRSALRNHDRT